MSLAFSGCGRFLAAQGGAPDWGLCLWAWEKSKLVATARPVAAPGHTAAQVLFQLGARGAGAGAGQGAGLVTIWLLLAACNSARPPTRCPTAAMPRPAPTALPGDDPQQLSVVGEGVCALFQIEAGNTLRPLPCTLPRLPHTGFTCHAWLLDNDAAGTLAVGTRRGEVLVVADGEVRQTLQLGEGVAVDSLAAHSKARWGRAGRGSR